MHTLHTEHIANHSFLGCIIGVGIGGARGAMVPPKVLVKSVYLCVNNLICGHDGSEKFLAPPSRNRSYAYVHVLLCICIMNSAHCKGCTCAPPELPANDHWQFSCLKPAYPCLSYYAYTHLMPLQVTTTTHCCHVEVMSADTRYG